MPSYKNRSEKCRRASPCPPNVAHGDAPLRAKSLSENVGGHAYARRAAAHGDALLRGFRIGSKSRPRLLFRRLRSRRGQAALEMALLLPVLMVLLFGIIISGFTFYAFIQVSNAAREGARAGSVYRLTQAQSGLTLDQTVKQAIHDSGSGTSALGFLDPNMPSFDVNSDVAVTWVDIDVDTVVSSGDQVAVSVTYRYTLPIVSVLLPMFPQPIVIVRDVTMEIQ